MTQPTVTKQLTALEQHLKTCLLNRSTRQLSLTEAGSAYFEIFSIGRGNKSWTRAR